MSSESLGLLRRLSTFVFNVMTTLQELGTLCEAGGEVHPLQRLRGLPASGAHR